ncbi:MAG: TetR/AcrR family transcriptional regulator [Deltaproteobacteria bacterium]|nr:TetR/AcrR family transcriptional regulator [Deltaproteobacteria bacterium]
MRTIHTTIKSDALVLKKRRQIVTAVVKLFFKKGFDRTSMREIFRAAGVTIGNLYDYIGKKEDLRYLVHDYMIKGVYTTLYETEHMKWSGLDKFRSTIRAFLGHSLEFKDEILLTYRQTWLLKKPVREALLAQESEKINKIKELLDQGVREGALHIENTEITANIIVYLVAMPALRGWNMKQYRGDEIVDTLTNFIMKGVL